MEYKRPGGEMKPAHPQEPTPSQMLPLAGKWDELWKRPYFVPALVVVGLLLGLLTLANYPGLSVSIPVKATKDLLVSVKMPYSLLGFAAMIAAGSMAVIYRMAGKRSGLLFYLALGALVAYLTKSDLFNLVAGFIRGTFGKGDVVADDNVLVIFWKMFIDAGLTEEFFKAIPLFGLVLLGASKMTPFNERFGLREPLDGILLGAAAGVGFSFAETMFQYIPRQMFNSDSTSAIQLLVFRMGSEVFGHSAYAGYFGYFIGLGCLYPRRRWKLLAIGLLTSSTLHALWNSVGQVHDVFGFLVAAVSFAFLSAAILKAREISPNRARLAPSELLDRFASGRSHVVPAAPVSVAAPPQPRPVAASAPYPAPAPAPVAAAFPASYAAPAPAAHPVVAPPAVRPTSPAQSETWGDEISMLVLEIGTARVPIAVGARLLERQAPGTKSQLGDGVVAEVTAKPDAPDVLGLKNSSTATWQVTTDKGDVRSIPPGRSIRVARGTKIQLGDLVAVVR